MRFIIWALVIVIVIILSIKIIETSYFVFTYFPFLDQESKNFSQNSSESQTYEVLKSARSLISNILYKYIITQIVLIFLIIILAVMTTARRSAQ